MRVCQVEKGGKRIPCCYHIFQKALFPVVRGGGWKSVGWRQRSRDSQPGEGQGPDEAMLEKETEGPRNWTRVSCLGDVAPSLHDGSGRDVGHLERQGPASLKKLLLTFADSEETTILKPWIWGCVEQI